MVSPGLIVNADDLGIHPSIDAGIFEAFERGVLTSATLLVTTPFAAASAQEARRCGLPVGLHFSLTLGRSVAPRDEIPDLVDRDGNLIMSAAKILMLGDVHGRHRNLYCQIGREIDAQFISARAFGLALTHVDSHQHIHMNPYVFKMIEDAAERYGVRCLRISREPFYFFELGNGLLANLQRLNPAKLALVRLLERQIVPRLRTNDRFFGLMYSGQVTEKAFARMLAHIERYGGVYEIGLHPGHCAPADNGVYLRPEYNDFISSPSREAELRLLIDPATEALVQVHGIRLMSYGDLARGAPAK